MDKSKCHWISLLKSENENRFALRPQELRAEILALKDQIEVCVIDEIQKVPALLNEVHFLLEDEKVDILFVLTGSSARKLKAGGANLLAGRALWRSLYPLLMQELDASFKLQECLSWGGLPEVWNAKL